jgi:hypothetical protein
MSAVMGTFLAICDSAVQPPDQLKVRDPWRGVTGAGSPSITIDASESAWLRRVRKVRPFSPRVAGGARSDILLHRPAPCACSSALRLAYRSAAYVRGESEPLVPF